MIFSSHNIQESTVLFQSGDRKVSYCYQTKVFFICYGALTIDLFKPAMERLLSQLQAAQNSYDLGKYISEGSIEITTPYRGLRLLLSYTELLELNAMLKQAYQALDARYTVSQYN